MNQSKRRLTLLSILLLPFFSLLLFSQNSISIGSNSNGVVTYKTKFKKSKTLLFTLFGDGTFGFQNQPKHKFDSNSNGYTTEAYFVSPYDTNLPTKLTVNTGSVGSGSNMVNTLPPMSGEVDLFTSWSVASGYQHYFIIAFTNTQSANPVNGCIEFYYNHKELTINTPNIKVYNNWVSNRTHSSLTGPLDRRIKWDFTNLKQNEIRYVYVPVVTLKAARQKLNVSAKYLPGCNPESGKGATKNAEYIIQGTPHDPNSKVSNRNCFQENFPIEYQEYTISFFNDGNGFAKNVYIYDSIVPFLDTNTIQFIDSEYPCTLSVEGSMLHIEFQNIFLPGTNQTVPHAYTYQDASTHVTFGICTSMPLFIGDSIFNTANIIFDNQPSFQTDPSVVYCTECTEFDACSADEYSNNMESSTAFQTNASSFKVFPNPFSDHFNINFTSQEKTTLSIDLLDYSGDLVKHLLQADEVVELVKKPFYIDDLPKGIYILVLRTPHKTYTQKIVKI